MSEPNCSCFFIQTEYRWLPTIHICSFEVTLLSNPCVPAFPPPPQWKNPKIIFHIPRNPLFVTTTTKRQFIIAHGNYTSIANCQEKKYPPIFRSIFGILHRISSFCLFIPPFFAEPGFGFPGVSTIKSSDISLEWISGLHWSGLKTVSIVIMRSAPSTHRAVCSFVFLVQCSLCVNWY
jgi:hypothetical protein